MQRMTRLGLAAGALAALALPLAAFATAEDTAQDPAAATVLTAEQLAKGRQLFTDNGCNACHALADAQAAGSVGPAFDGNANLDKAHAANVITNGQGAMPSFGWLDAADIDLLASYIVQAKK